MPSNDGSGAPLLLHAPGGPGVPARWTSSAKSGVGTAPGIESRVWFSISHGILNEVYYPRVDRACTRDLGLVITGPEGFFSEEKRHTTHSITRLAQGVPAFHLVNTCNQGRYVLHKEVLTDPIRDVLLQEITFAPQVGTLADYRVHPLLASHLGNRGDGNSAWLGDYKGVQMLFAERDGTALALAASVPWRRRSVGFVGQSDGWQQLKKHGALVQEYSRADDGNVALCGELDLSGLPAGGGKLLLALSFGRTAAEAAHHALTSLWRGFAVAREKYLDGWHEAQRDLEKLDEPVRQGRNNYRVSTSVLRTHESKEFHGGIIASLSVPWGASKGDGDLGGYHLAWPRDLVETAGALLAAGAHADARRVLRYLAVTQEPDGHWPQNLWIDGTPYWNGIQMDETAFPILLVDLAFREGALDDDGALEFWPVVKKAAAYLAQNGPVTQEDRWEEDGGYSPFTLSAEIAALLAAADLADLAEERAAASYLRETADAWNSSVERWTFVRKGSLGKSVSASGYYVRTAPDDVLEEEQPDAPLYIPIKNRLEKSSRALASEIVSPDALALVRFGLRAADDPRILSTVKVIDAVLKTEFATGPCWRRYNEDGYGEHEDGSPFDGTGVGRPWPLLTGERAHYELALGNQDVAEKLLLTFESFASDGGLFPEQIWDQEDLPKRELFRGRPSGSAMPLVWAHSEHIKLLRSLRDGKVFDTPPQTVRRYQVEKVESPRVSWRFNHKLRRMPQGKLLRIETQAPARIRFSTNGWYTNQDLETRDSGLGMHFADLPTGALQSAAQVVFTFYWPEAARWEGADFSVAVSADNSNPIGVP